jgi:DNA polymerase I
MNVGAMDEGSKTGGGPALPEPGAPGVFYMVDISGYVFRAFYALPPLTNERGEPTGALYGVTTMLLKLVRETRPDMLAVVMDGKGHSFRKELFAEYKANRPSAPTDLQVQMARVREVADAYAIPCYEREGVEADDLIASLTRVARARGHRVVLVSADKDLLQLVGDGVWMLDTMKQRGYGPAETKEKLGVLPGQVRDYLALTGDSSDNIPGVPSVGPKTAADLLNQYGSLDGVYAGLETLTKKALKQKLIEHRELAYLSRELVTLKDDFELPFEESLLRYGGFDDETLRTFFKRYGFVRLLDQLPAASAPKASELIAVARAASAAPPAQLTLGEARGSAGEPSLKSVVVVQEVAVAATSVRVITTAAELAAAAEGIARAGRLTLFCAAESDEPIAGALVGVGLGFAEDAVYVPLGHRYLGCPEQLSLAQVKETLAPLLENPAIEKLSSNMKRDTIALAQQGIALAGVTFDTMLASYLLDPDLRGHGVVEIALRQQNLELPSYVAVTGKGKAQRPLEALTFDEILPWVAPELTLLPGLAARLSQELSRDKLRSVLDSIELPLASVLAEMERRGVRCDPDKLRELSLIVDKELAAKERLCYELAGKEFNVGSPRQLETILFDELALPVIERTKTARSTNAEVLEELAVLHPLPAAIVEHRVLAKLKGTYLDALPREINAKTGRIHTKFEQAVAATGRLSSNDPNLQNIPIRTEIGRLIRDAFVAEPGMLIFSADYSQIELRVLAHLSADEVLSRAFAEHADVHVLTAQALFNVDAGQVTRDQRAAAKTVNFAVIYGQTQFALARNLRIARGEAARYIKAFFERYAGVRRYLDLLVDEARTTGAVRTLCGRRRLVRDILAKNHSVRSGAERIAQNAPIQGSAADIMKLAMVRVQSALARERMRAHMVLTVHDELVFEAPESERTALEALVREAMEGAVKLNVPLEVGTGWGESWGKAH